MSEKKEFTVEDVVNRLTDTIKEIAGGEEFDDIESIRLGLGCVLSGIHKVYLYGAKTPEDQKECAAACWDTIKRLMDSFGETLNELKIDGVQMVAMKVPVEAMEAFDELVEQHAVTTPEPTVN